MNVDFQISSILQHPLLGEFILELTRELNLKFGPDIITRIRDLQNEGYYRCQSIEFYTKIKESFILSIKIRLASHISAYNDSLWFYRSNLQITEEVDSRFSNPDFRGKLINSILSRIKDSIKKELDDMVTHYISIIEDTEHLYQKLME